MSNKQKEIKEKQFNSVKISNNKKEETICYLTTQSFLPLNDIELANLHKIDLNKYEVINYWTKLLPNGKFTSSLFVKLIKKEIEKQNILEISKEIFKLSPSRFSFISSNKTKNNSKKYLYEISCPDLHIGKLAHKEESGNDYDSKIAIKNWNNAIDDLLNRVNINTIEKILLPIGNDMINIDNSLKTTTNGTPQDVDTRFNKMIISTRDMLINTINQLSKLTKVDVIVVPGNHDQNIMFTVGLILEAYFKNNNNVKILNSSYSRHYYKYYNSSIMFTHGNNEKHSDLGQIFANEQRELWGQTAFHYCQLGHYHKSKKIQNIIHDEYQGFQVQIIPSLSMNDFWHSSKGYDSKHAAKSFLFDQKDGIIAEYTYNLK